MSNAPTCLAGNAGLEPGSITDDAASTVERQHGGAAGVENKIVRELERQVLGWLADACSTPTPVTDLMRRMLGNGSSVQPPRGHHAGRPDLNIPFQENVFSDRARLFVDGWDIPRRLFLRIFAMARAPSNRSHMHKHCPSQHSGFTLYRKRRSVESDASWSLRKAIKPDRKYLTLITISSIYLQ